MGCIHLMYEMYSGILTRIHKALGKLFEIRKVQDQIRKLKVKDQCDSEIERSLK